jgi:hypothetical protein
MLKSMSRRSTSAGDGSGVGSAVGCALEGAIEAWSSDGEPLGVAVGAQAAAASATTTTDDRILDLAATIGGALLVALSRGMVPGDDVAAS